MSALVVPDASVILKWVLPKELEPDAGAAGQLLEDFVAGDVALLVPSLWYFEVGNTITRLFPERSSGLLGALRGLDLPEAELTQEWEEAAIRLVRGHGATYYDAAYHALAQVADGTFVTADRRYLERVAGEPAIAPLAGYPWGP
ncbi:MAG: type II toxin-antitoxin system VapC family toxin [Acidobacteriota bacterium]